LAQSGLVVAVQLEGGRARLVVELTKARPDNWLLADSAVVTPRDVAAFVRLGIARGWQPAGRGGTFLMRVDDGN
jgi:hypothetical protein